MQEVKSKAALLPRFQSAAQVNNNARRRRIFDSVVWTASLLFAFGMLIDSALAKDAEKGASIPVASCKAERGDIHWHAVRNRR